MSKFQKLSKDLVCMFLFPDRAQSMNMLSDWVHLCRGYIVIFSFRSSVRSFVRSFVLRITYW